MAGPGRIELVGVTKEYRLDHSTRREALKDVTLTIDQGEFLGIIGRNGSGKTTLARLLNGLVLPTSGRVLVNGLDTADRGNLPAIRRLVGMVFQNPDHQIVSSIVEEDIAFGPENLGLDAAEVGARTGWALRALGLEDLRSRAPHLLSGGQKQKVAIAAALAMQPSYLVLDEPASMLDPAARAALLATLQSLHADHGLTIVLLSHCLEDVVQADRLVVLHRGGVHLADPPAEVLTAFDRLAQAGLEPPDVVRMADHLRRCGRAVDRSVVTVGQLVECLCPS